MRNWRFALTRRWFGYLGMVVVFTIACVLLSHWQISRNAETSTNNTLVTRNYNAAVAPLTQLLPERDAFDVGDRWRPVTMEGVYDSANQLLVRNRSYGNNPGYEVLTPLTLADGSVFVVDRGWLPVGTKQDYPDHVPAAPTGTVQVVVRLQATEPVLPGRSAPKGQIPEINVAEMATMIGAKSAYTQAYGLMQSESPSTGSRPLAAAKPTVDPGPYLSYAFQWLLFAVFAFAGLGWALRNEYRIRNADDPEERVRAAERQRKASKRAPSDSEVEDAIVADALSKTR